MAASKELADFITDMLEPLGDIHAHRMFGGYGIKYGEVNFALLLGDQPYFRVDDRNRPVFEERGSEPFRYNTKKGEVTVGSYWEVPTNILEDPELFLEWARAAIDAALKAHKPKKKRKRS
ncbi:TfoX/Sxy family protein [Nisaea sp.]|uniref:TfoX/Sxy family protein n=1 Tax=Nisaea sp. TaxID=2024842 RepID=UPI002B279DBD|nr:TfoX/Sxy family protein [Nisaea sp.]